MNVYKMRLKEFLKEDFKTPIMDLNPSQLVDVLNTFNEFIVRENCKGEFLNIGVDLDGKIYATRNLYDATDKKTRIYNVSEFGNSSSVNQFKAVFAACLYKADLICKHMKPGSAIQIAFEFNQGTTYQLELVNHIKFIKSIPGDRADLNVDQNVVELLNKELSDDRTSIKVQLIIGDGDDISTNDVTTTFDFGSLKKVVISKKFLDNKASKLLSYLSEPVDSDIDELSGMKNLDVAMLSMSTIKMNNRDKVNEIKEHVLQKINGEFKPWLIAMAKEHSEYGLLLIHPSGEMTVDLSDNYDEVKKDAERWLKKICSPILSVDDEENIFARGGVVGEFIISAATIFGEKQLAIKSHFRKVTSDFSDPFDGIAQSINDDISDIKRYVTVQAVKAINQLIAIKDDFLSSDKYTDVGNDRIAMSESDVAEINNLIAENITKMRVIMGEIKSAETMADVVKAIFNEYAS